MWTSKEKSILPQTTRNVSITPLTTGSNVGSFQTWALGRRWLQKVLVGVTSLWLLLYFIRPHLSFFRNTPISPHEDPVLKTVAAGTLVGSGGTFLVPSAQEEPLANFQEGDFVLTMVTPNTQDLVHGLLPESPQPTDMEPSSPLGLEADAAYKMGATDMKEYRADLTAFITNHFPLDLQQPLLESLHLYTTINSSLEVDFPKLGGTSASRKIWMTDKDDRRMGSSDVNTWRENKDGYDLVFLDDRHANMHIREALGDSRLADVWNALPSGILHSDALRYLLLLLHGGVYTDLDTQLLRPVANWGQHYDLYRQGRGWLFEEDSETDPDDEQIEEWKEKLGRPSVIVGLETDVGNRHDWHDWWPRPVQMVQWTMASSPHHPIFLDTLLGITRATHLAYKWLETPSSDSSRPPIDAEPSQGGPVGVMEWTGPGVWTDSVLRYLRVKYGLKWADLRELKNPLRLGEVVVLPVSGFSPGVGLFGANEPSHPSAMVQHKFAGTWKGD